MIMPRLNSHAKVVNRVKSSRAFHTERISLLWPACLWWVALCQSRPWSSAWLVPGFAYSGKLWSWRSIFPCMLWLFLSLIWFINAWISFQSSQISGEHAYGFFFFFISFRLVFSSPESLRLLLLLLFIFWREHYRFLNHSSWYKNHKLIYVLAYQKHGF
jgi:hypothetical protein